MKKVLIISYYAPPCNLTPSQRIGGWKKYFPEFGFFPVIFTRKWTGNEITDFDRVKDTLGEIEVLSSPSSETHYLPYSSNLRDKSYVLSSSSYFFKFLSKLLTLMNTIFQNIFVKSIPYANIYFYAKSYLKANSDVKYLIVSGNPFEQFFFAYLLKKEFPNLQWIADYRDDWTSNPLYKKKSLLFTLLNKFNQYFEKKWIKTSSALLSVSQEYCDRLSALHKKKCTLIMNGFNPEIFNIPANEKLAYFQISYSGTIYPNQDFSLILDAISSLAQKIPSQKVKLTFLGSKVFLPENYQKIFDNYTLHNLEIELTERLSWEKSVQFLKNSDLLLLTPYGNLTGIPSSKIFDYFACQKPILLAPSDNDIMEELINHTQAGKACNTVLETQEFIQNCLLDSAYVKFNFEKMQEFSAKNQVQKLSILINNL